MLLSNWFAFISAAPSYQQSAKVNLGAKKPKIQLLIQAPLPQSNPKPPTAPLPPRAPSVNLDVNAAFASVQSELVDDSTDVAYLESKWAAPRAFFVRPDELRLNAKAWLTNLHINHYLELIKKEFKSSLVFNLFSPEFLEHSNVEFQPYDPYDFRESVYLLHAKDHWVVLSSIDLPGVVNETDEQMWFIFDSLSWRPGNFLLATLCSLKPQFNKLFAGLSSLKLHHFKHSQQQVGTSDCGLFALAYVHSLSLKRNPSTIVYKQDIMRAHFNSTLATDFRHLFEFPEHGANGTISLTSVTVDLFDI